MFAVVDVHWESTYKRLYELDDSLRVGWWGYHMLLVLVEEGIGKAEVGYIDFGETIEK